MGMVQNYERQYCIDIANVSSYGLDEEDSEAMRNEVYNKYNRLLNSLTEDKNVLAYCAYTAAYCKKGNTSKSTSFPWTCCFEEMLSLLEQNRNASMLVSLPHSDEDPSEVVVTNTGMMFVNGKAVEVVDYEVGTYNVVKLDNDFYINVRRQVTLADNKVRVIAKKEYQFSVLGFYKHLGLTATEVVEAIKGNNGEFSIVGVDGKTMVVVS